MTIPFWAVLYIIMLLGLDAWDAVLMRRRGKGLIAIATENLATLIIALVFAGYFHPPLIARFGRLTLPAFVLAFGYLAIEASVRIFRTEPDPTLSPRQDLIAGHFAVVFAATIMAPAAAFGMLASLRAW